MSCTAPSAFCCCYCAVCGTVYVRCDDVCQQVQLSLGDFVAARRSLKKALQLGSQQTLDRQAVKKAFKYGENRFWPSLAVSSLKKNFFSSTFLNSYTNFMICFFNFTADQGFKLEEEWGEDQGRRLGSHQAAELAEQLGDLYCKVGCYGKAVDAYRAQVRNLRRHLHPWCFKCSL